MKARLFRLQRAMQLPPGDWDEEDEEDEKLPATTGSRVYGTARTLHSGAGRLLGYLISHGVSSAQAVTFYDNTAASGTVLHKVHVAPEQCPYYVRFGAPGEAIPFATGLTVDPGNCDVLVWGAS